MQTCIEVFKHKYEQENKTTVTDNYIFTPGIYLCVDLTTGNIVEERSFDKKTEPLKDDMYYDLAFYDYNSRLITMNKPIDPSKIIHSNNYCAFFVKNEGKLQEETIDKYYDILAHPEKNMKKKPEQRKLYEQFMLINTAPDQEKINKCKSWIKKNIFNILEEKEDSLKKNYLRIFFIDNEDNSQTKVLFETEGKRYIYPNIFNDAKYNQEIDKTMYGMPGLNLGLNSKKPFLATKTRKNEVPYLLQIEDVLMQKIFFDYLETLCNVRKNIVFIDSEKKTIDGYSWGELPNAKTFTGMFLYLKKGKEIEVHDIDVVPKNSNTIVSFKLQDYLQLHNSQYTRFEIKKVTEKTKDKNSMLLHFNDEITVKTSLAMMIDQVFFSKAISRNNMLDDEDIKMTSKSKQIFNVFRQSYRDWLYKGEKHRFVTLVDKLLPEHILNTFAETEKNQFLRVQQMIILRENLLAYFTKEKGGKQMGTRIEELQNIRTKVANIIFEGKGILENDAEFYYAVGQLASYLLSLSRAQYVTLDPVVKMMKLRDAESVQQELQKLLKKYAYAINYTKYSEELKRQTTYSTRFGNLHTACELYNLNEEAEKNNKFLMIGFTDKTLM